MSSTSRRGVIVGPTRYLDAKTERVAHTLDLLDLDAKRGHDPGRARFGGSHVYTWDRPSGTHVQAV